MSSTDETLANALQELRRCGRELSAIPGRQKGSLPKVRLHELSTIVARAVAVGVDINDLERELPPYPPLVIGRAMASVWGELSADRRSSIVARLKTLDSERILGEALPMVVQLLKTSATANLGAEIAAVLPGSERTAQRVATEILGESSLALANLRVPDDDMVAAAMLRVLLKAAVQEKAQPFRRFQLLRLVLPWLESRDRYRNPQLLDLTVQVRELPKKITGPAFQEWSQALAKEAGWRHVLGVEAASAPDSAVLPPADPTAPTPSGEEASIASKAVPLESTPARHQELSLEDARSTVESLRDQRFREALALDRLLAAVRASEYARVQSELDVQVAREREGKALAQQDSLDQQVEELRSEMQVLQAKHKRISDDLTGKDSECGTLAEQLAKERESLQAVGAEFEHAARKWKEEQAQLETQVVENARARVTELGNRLASRLDKLLADVPQRSAGVKGDGAAAVLHTRIHELLDVLRAEGIPLRLE